ncbi:MAG: Pup--protein ligase, partial [Acidimicrobiia bacterium]|nr:Pup--protein ligase [Acidimicrobiia bacterium]
RDEPHADAEQYRRLHVIAGDSNMNEYATFVKVGVTAALLEMIESGVIFRDRTLANPIRAIREISSDPTCKRLVELANGRRLSALDIQWEYWEQTTKNAGFSAPIQQAVDLWGELLTGLEKDPLGLDRRVDWVTKQQLIERYRAKHGLALSDAKVQLLDLSYHDVTKSRSLYYLLLSRGVVDRLVPEVDVAKAKKNPPQTRALLRGRFIAAAKAKNRDYQADWVHLKLNDQAQRTVICKDPFKYEDDRVEQLIAGL